MVPTLTKAGARVAAIALAILIGFVSWASTAGAHAALVSTTPAAGAVLPTAPPEVVLEFDEPVEVAIGGVRLHDAEGERIEPGAQVEGAGNRVVLPLGPLDEGSYVVTYRVASADGHPIEGAFTFRVGEGTIGEETTALADELLAAQGGSAAVGAVYAVVRGLVFASLAVLTGLVAFVVFVRSSILAGRAGAALLWGSWVLLVAATVASVGLQGLSASGLPLGDLVDASLWSAVLETRFGTLAAVRLGLLVAAIPLVVVAARTTASSTASPPSWWRLSALAGSVGLYLTVSLAGHADSGQWVQFAVGADVVHLGAMSAWLGGLVVLLVLVFPASPDVLSPAIPRFSTVAFWCVVALVVTGSFQSVRQVGGLDAFTSTTYGQVLLLKVGVVAVAVASAAYSRVAVTRLRAPSAGSDGSPVGVVSDELAGESSDQPRQVARLRWSVALEVGLGALVLGITALLVNLVPAIDDVEAPYAAQLTEESFVVDFVVDPAATGEADVHVYTLGETGMPQEVADVLVDLSLEGDDIGPLSVPMERAGEGHFVAQAFELPIPGDWTAEIRVLPTEFESVVLTTTVPVR